MAAIVDRGRDRLRDHSSWDFAVPIDPVDPEDLSSHPSHLAAPSDHPLKVTSQAQRSATSLGPRNERNASPASGARKHSNEGASRSRSNTQNGKAAINAMANRESMTHRHTAGNARSRGRANSTKRSTGPGKLSVDTNIESSDSDRANGDRHGARSSRNRTGKSVDAIRVTKKHNEDYWIDRDKLAKIESQELQQYGIQLPGAKTRKGAGSRAGSRASSQNRLRAEAFPEMESDAAERSQDNRDGPHRESGRTAAVADSAYAWTDTEVPDKRQQEDMMHYTAEPEELRGDDREEMGYFGVNDEASDDPASQYPNALTSFDEHARELSTPTGDYASAPSSAPGSDPTSPNSYGSRKASSKIPVPSLSRLPVPPAPASNDRPSTSPRSRANTGSSTDALAGRSRRQNSNHQRADTAESNTSASASGGSHGSTSTSNSPEPPKDSSGQYSRSNRQSRPLSTGSVPAKVQQQLKHVSAGSKTNRDSGGTRTPGPHSRRGSQAKGKRRPSNARAQQSRDYQKEPMGDPPWLASSFRPDPRLPPEQQILPTHAKKMLQEQWEKEGKTGVLYDKSFAPLAVVDDWKQFQAPVLAGNKDGEDDAKDGSDEVSVEGDGGQRSPTKFAMDDTKLLSPVLGSPNNFVEETSEPQPPPPVAQRPPIRRSGSSYRTMPPIQRMPSSSPSSRGPGSPLAQPPMPSQPPMSPKPAQSENIRQQDAEKVAEEKGKKKEAGCACCIIM